MNKNTIWLFVCSFFLLTSCKTKEKASELNYMQNAEQVAVETALHSTSSTIQKGDQLVILITAKDMDVVKPFNQNYSSSEPLVQIPAGGNINAMPQTVSGPTYVVDTNGNIDFPVVGIVNTTGKNIADLKDELRSRISKYVINPAVTVRLTNFKVTVLGEVNRQGDYVIPNGQGTLLNALGLAGDLTMYAKRDDVLIVRNIDGEITKGRVNLIDSNFINSSFFNLKQGDVIYVSANETKEKTAKLDPRTGIYISIASIALGLAGIFITIFKK